jgi:signal peptidase II
LPVESLWVRLSLGLQLGGTLGNLMDRMIRGFVVDFIEIGFLPIFNLADVAIVTGLAMLAYYFWQQEEVAAADQDFLNVSEGDGL